VYRQLKQEWPGLARQLPHFPGLVHDALQQSARPQPALSAPKGAPRSDKTKGHWSGMFGLSLVIAAAVAHPIPLEDQFWFAPASVVLALVGILVLWNRGNR
jgi:hypothetical protein